MHRIVKYNSDENKQPSINFVEPVDKQFAFAKFDERLNFIVYNWRKTSMVKIFNGFIYINLVSFPFATELLRNNGINFTVKTEL